MNAISTAARRMAREFNSYSDSPRRWELTFGNDGHVTSAGEFTSAMATPDFLAGQGARMTQRDAQDFLDAQAAPYPAEFAAVSTGDSW